jgi:hypothetical protein
LSHRDQTNRVLLRHRAGQFAADQDASVVWVVTPVIQDIQVLEVPVAGQSISAHADAATVARLGQTAAREGRTPSQITASSLKLYLALPGTVRAARRDIEVLGTPEDAVARTVVPAQYEVARRQAAEGMRLDNEDLLETGEDILTGAVRATAKDL